MKAAVTNVEEDLSRNGKRFTPKCVTLVSSNYAPWLEYSPEIMVGGVYKYQELIDHIRWYVDIRCLDILLETLLL